MEARTLIGREVEGRFGTMHPTEFGALVEATAEEVVIQWENGKRERFAHDIVLEDEKQTTLVPVGIFVMPYNAPGF